MNSKKAGNLFMISIICIFWIVSPLFSQQGDNPSGAWKWYFSRRAFPYDTVPRGSYENAMNQRVALLQNTGFQSLATTWEEIGPKPYANTFSGRIAHVVYDTRDPNELGNYIYVTGAYGGLWKTTDGGQNWVNKSGDLPSLLAGAFTLDASRNILYFGTSGTPNTWVGAGNSLRVFMSTNDGTNWVSISNGIDVGASINKIVISPNDANGNTLFAATSLGLFKTTNRGSLWVKMIPNDGTSLICSDVCFSPNGSRVHAVGPSSGRSYPWNLIFDGIGYFRSDDGGNNFSQITNNGFPHSGTLTATTLCAVSKAQGGEDLVWFLSYDDDGTADGYVYKSTNYGQNFTSRVVGSNWATKYHLSLRASDVDINVCYAGNMYLHKTTDGSQSSWSCIGGYCGAHGDVKGFDINPFYPDKITEGNDGGVFRQDYPYGNWISCNQNLGSLSLLWGLATSTYDVSFVAGGLHDFSSFSYNSNTGPGNTNWDAASGGSGDCGNVMASPFKSKHFVSNILTSHQEIYYSSNGTNFGYASDYAASSTYSIEVGPFTYHPTNPGEVYTIRFNQWGNPMNVQFRKSTDYGMTWGGDLTPFRSFDRPSDHNHTAPCFVAISQSNPENMIMSFGNGNEFWLSAYDARSWLIKSTDGGSTWEGIDNNTDPIVVGGSGGTPNRAFMDVEFDPKDPSLLYLAVSGYYYPSTNEGHVFKSTDGGYNWVSINGSLPDIPVNDILIHYTGTDAEDKELIVATDAGVYVTNANDINWRELASDFPNTPAFHLDYNRLSGKLRANTWGRGGWEYQLDNNTIYVQDKLYITDNVVLDKPIVVTNGGKLIIGHSSVNSSMGITFNNGAKIIVEEGGTLLANSNVAVTLTSSGSWDGIEVYGNYSNCVLKNCTFSNTETPVVVSTSPPMGVPITPEYGVIIDDCHFTNAPVEITGRKDVTIRYSDWTMNTTAGSDAIVASGAENLYLLYNDINYTSQVSGSHAIQISQSDNSTITRSTIINCDYPITVSNGTYYIRYSDISTSYATTSVAGIYLNGVNNGHLIANDVSGYQMGYQLINSTPGVLLNTADGSNANGNKSAIYCDGSSPVMFPTVTKTEVIWDGGLNNLRNDATNGVGLYNSIDGGGDPKLDYGYNIIVGDINIDGGYPYSTWYVRCNSWENNPPVFNTGVTMEYLPTDCTPPDSRPFSPNEPRGGSEMGKTDNIENIEIPPQPLIVDYGNGLIDTFNVATLSIEVTADVELLGDGNKEMYLNNFQDAIDIFKTVVQNYQDSTTALVSLNRIFYCYDRMNADSSSYNSLINYYSNLSSSNTTDTFFVKTANELSRKCLVKQRNYISAINAYEDVIENSNDPSEILAAEISIIEIYVMMNSGSGDAMSYTGRYSSLKPNGLRDAMRMIREKMGHSNNQSVTNLIPKQFSLSQNYPNPFNPLTTIKYAIPSNTKVSLRVYDILGKLVRTIVNEFKEAGNYSVSFDGSGLSSGVYFYKIEAGDFVQSKKMVLVK